MARTPHPLSTQLVVKLISRRLKDEGTLSPAIVPMYPFANTPHLWLTDHLERQKQQEHIVKIQAAAKGFLVRRRSRLRLQARAPPSSTLEELLREHGLAVWADACPSATEAVLDEDRSKERQECLLHASMTLRLLNKMPVIQELEWADYHERTKAFHKLYDVGSPVESIWQKFRTTLGM